MTNPSAKPDLARVDFLECATTGLLYYYLSSLVVVVGVVFGHDFVEPPKANPLSKRRDYVATFANWDGDWFERILRKGYSLDPSQRPGTAFFPAYPLLGRFVTWTTGCDPDLALLIVSHLSLAATFVLAAAYVRLRFPGPSHAALPGFVLLALGLFPPGCFFRMVYTESLFVLLTILVLYGMERRWPLLVIALLAGASSSVRAVGLALVPALAFHLRQRSPRWTSFAVRGAVLGPLACWGILAYVLYQQVAFGDPLVFYRTEIGMRRTPEEGLGRKLLSDVTLKPIWSVFDPSCPSYWQAMDVQTNPLFSIPFANPLYFLAGVLLLAVGVWKRWLTGPEIMTALFLLLIPYVSKGGANSMLGMSRFVAAVFPLYIVLGRLLACLPAPLAAAAAAVSTLFLGAYSALFAAWHTVY
jgi:hypothetical protein